MSKKSTIDKPWMDTRLILSWSPPSGVPFSLQELSPTELVWSSSPSLQWTWSYWLSLWLLTSVTSSYSCPWKRAHLVFCAVVSCVYDSPLVPYLQELAWEWAGLELTGAWPCHRQSPPSLWTPQIWWRCHYAVMGSQSASHSWSWPWPVFFMKLWRASLVGMHRRINTFVVAWLVSCQACRSEFTPFILPGCRARGKVRGRRYSSAWGRCLEH